MHSLAQRLGYTQSGNYIPAGEAAAFDALPFSHLCRRGLDKLGLQGVYVLRSGTTRAPVPVVALCKADTEEKARAIHRLVWNQDYVPFVLVESPSCVRLYSGFAYPEGQDGTQESGLITPLRDFNEITEALSGFRAEEIDDGTLWSKWGRHVDPQQRVDWRLLKNLNALALKLRGQGLGRDIAHAFIGRYVYLRYLRDRGFLSERKLTRWGFQDADIFSRAATLKAFREVTALVDSEKEGFNGSIFPFPASRLGKEHLTTVACAFAGDDVASGQTVFDFYAYDFSYIPVETLSVIYEQFLHEPDESSDGKGRGKTKTKGREEGAYYTPIPLVNFMIAEMDARLPLGPGMKVADPSCGSGAFLVQTYRVLIERAIRASGRDHLPPSELRSILQNQIFGVDRDGDACRIAEMSLLVTLLDYVDPPDLEGKYKDFRLPKLSGHNIFEADFFDPDGSWAQAMNGRKEPLQFDWIIGNPPWKELKAPPKNQRDQLALDWMLAKDAPPTGGNQLAEAFVWKSQPCLREKGIAGMVLPAMTLFKGESAGFCRGLFSAVDVWSVVNFANLCYVLFSGRVNVPAMSLFFQKPEGGEISREPVQTFAPMVINQVANRPLPGKQLDTWNLVMNGSEVREIPHAEAATGEALTWKLAMWGSNLDGKLLARLAKKFETLETFAAKHGLQMAEGFQLRDDPIGLTARMRGGCLQVQSVVAGGPGDGAGIQAGDRITRINQHEVADLTEEAALKLLHGSEGGTLRTPVKRSGPPGGEALELEFGGDKVEHHPELEGEWELSFGKLKGCGRIVDFPDHALGRIPASHCWIRTQGGLAGLPVSQPPHLIVDATRRFVVYRNDFVCVPPRKIGVSSSDTPESAVLLRSLALLLSSSLCQYFEFLRSPEWGVQTSISTLESLKQLRVPDLAALSGTWATIHEQIERRTPAGEAISTDDQKLIDRTVFKALGLRPAEQHLVADFARTQMLLVKGKVKKDALKPPSVEEMDDYLETLRDQLDEFMADDSAPASNHLTALCDGQTAMIEIILREGKPVKPVVLKAGAAAAAEMEKARAKKLKMHRQWIYFDRNLILQSQGRLYHFKPLQRIYWTRRQAILDAGELLAEAYSSDGD